MKQKLLIFLSSISAVILSNRDLFVHTMPTIFKLDQGKATWDLTPLLKSSGHILKDRRQDDTPEEYPYYYQFNIGDNMNTIPNNACKNTTGSDGSWSTSPAPAYKVWNDGKQCNRIGGDVTIHDNYAISVIDEENPTEGILIMFKNGDVCRKSGYGSKKPWQKGMGIYLTCEDDDTPLPTEETVRESIDCIYTMNIKSIHGCPIECPRHNNAVCSRNGECGWDKGLKQALCRCDQGYFGDACDATCGTSSGETSNNCNGNGHCSYDYHSKEAHCFCDEGFHGKDCESKPHGHGLGFLWFIMVCLVIALSSYGVYQYQNSGRVFVLPSFLRSFTTSSSGLASTGNTMNTGSFSTIGAENNNGGYFPPTTTNSGTTDDNRYDEL